MTFSDVEKTDIRRFLTYGAFGKVPDYAFGIRFLRPSGDLEYKMNVLQTSEEAIVRDYLDTLKDLETDLKSVSQNLDTARAAVWYHNKNELSDRIKLFNYFRKQLAIFFQVPVLNDAGGGNQPRLVV